MIATAPPVKHQNAQVACILDITTQITGVVSGPFCMCQELINVAGHIRIKTHSQAKVIVAQRSLPIDCSIRSIAQKLIAVVLNALAQRILNVL